MRDEYIRYVKFFREHLTAAMIMTDLDLELDGSTTVDEGIEYLANARYDVAIVKIKDNHKYVELERLRQCAERRDDGGAQILKSQAKEFPSTRIVSSDLSIRSVAEKLKDTSFPLLVAGREGPEFILTKYDFSSPAGIAAALLLAALVDSLLDKKLQEVDPETALAILDKKTVKKIKKIFKKKTRREEDLNILSLLGFDARLKSFNDVYEPLCQRGDAEWLVARRNDLAHGRHGKLDGADLLKFVIQMDSIFNQLIADSSESVL